MNDKLSDFIIPCFIRKNTPELCRKLEQLGYVNCNREYVGNTICTLPHEERGPEYMCFQMDNDFLNVIAPTYNSLDCDDNDDLFLAIAALRENNDYMQWFIDPITVPRTRDIWVGQTLSNIAWDIIDRKWIQYTEYNNKLSENIKSLIEATGRHPEEFMHKASIEELIEHFRNGEL